jgi:Secretion system C-terminal sorting domain
MLTGTGGALDFGLETGAGSYTVVASDPSTGCNNSMTGTAVITINPVVTPAVTISSPDSNNGCSSHMSTFTAMPVNGGASPVYHWTVNGVTAGTGNTYSYVPVNGDHVALTLTSDAICATTTTATASMTMSVGTTEIPNVTITSDPGDVVCQGTVVFYTALPSFGGSAPVYTWLVNGVAISGVTTANYSYAPSNGDSVWCVLHSNYHCRVHDTGASNAIVMTTQHSITPTVAVTASNGGTLVAGTPEIFTATVTNGGPSPEYQWYVDGALVPGATLPVFESTDLADLSVVMCRVTSSGVCSGNVGSGSVTVHSGHVGVQQVNAGEDVISVLPNPSKGAFNITGTLQTTADEAISIEITDMAGRSVYSGKSVSNGGKINERISLGSSVVNGMYLLSIRSEQYNHTFHIVVER